jgi:tetratricopeptide (TPR) repeat protein
MTGPIDVPATLARALALHQAGNIPEAAALYDVVLAREPRSFDALHMRGVIAAQAGRLGEALTFLERARPLAPGDPAFHSNMAFVLLQIGRPGEAATIAERGTQLDPRHAEGWFHLGLARQTLGDMAGAVAAYDQAVALRPALSGAWLNRGGALQRLGRWAEALASAERALALDAGLVLAQVQRAGSLLELQRPAEALLAAEAALGLQPGHADALFLRGNALINLGQPDAALTAYDEALRVAPMALPLHLNRAFALHALRRPEEALASLDQALALAPDNADVHSKRADVLRDLRRLDESLAAADRAVALAPNHAFAHGNRGNSLALANRLEEAIAAYDTALALKPDLAEAWCGRGAVLHALHRMPESRASSERALAIRPDYPEAHMNVAMSWLLSGDLPRGFQSLRWRQQIPEQAALLRFAAPAWDGSLPVEGQRIFVQWEQGFGDTLQFSRYVPLLTARGAHVVLSVQDPLLPLYAGWGPAVTVIGGAAPVPPCELHVPIMDLPAAFGTTVDSVPPPAPLAVDPARREAWAARLGPAARPRIGLVWAGQPTHRNDHNRSIPPALLAPLLAQPCEWLHLQPDQRADMPPPATVRHFGAALTDFAETAALIAQCELVISVDTSVAHLAGTLGVPTWLLLPWLNDWRWMLGREDTPWYPAMRLFRQGPEGLWPPVIERVGADLAARLAG